MTASLQDALAAVASGLDAALPAAVRCEVHHGPLDVDELSREAHAAPCILVVLPELTAGARVAGELVLSATWTAYVLTEAHDPGRRQAEALAIVERVIATISHADWGGTAGAAAQGITAQSLYSGDLDGRQVAVWAVRWSQVIDARSDVPDAELHDFRALSVEFHEPADPTSIPPDQEPCDACP